MVEQVVQRSDNGVSSSKRLFVVPFQDYLEDILLAEIRDKEGKESLLYPSHLLPTIARLVSAFDNSGVENIDIFGGRIKRFGMQYDNYSIDNADAVYGQEVHIHQLYNTLEGLKIGRNQNRIISLVGMKGTGKSNLLRLISKAYIEYSNKDENQRYITEIRLPFDIANSNNGRLGFNGGGDNKSSISGGNAFYSYRCTDSPLMLIPREIRKNYLKNKGINADLIPPYLLESEMCSTCQSLEDIVFRYYTADLCEDSPEGNNLELFFDFFSKYLFATKHRLRNGKEVTMFEVNTQKSPDILRFSLQPEYVGNANIPIYPLSNMPLATSELLLFDDLRAFERYWEDIRSIVSSGIYKPFENIWISKDSVIIVASNEEIDNIGLFKQDTGLIDRIIKVPLPSILRYEDEIKIYKKNIDRIGENFIIDPNVPKLISIFAVSGRLNTPRIDNIENILKKKLDKGERKLLESMTILEKVLFYNKSNLNMYDEDFEVYPNLSDKKYFSDILISAVFRDYYDDGDLSILEGFKGPSVRAVQDLYFSLAEWCSRKREIKIITAFDLFDFLENFPLSLTVKWTDDWKKKDDKGYDSPSVQISQLYEFYMNLLERQVLLSAIYLDEGSFSRTTEKYLNLLGEWYEKGSDINLVTGQNKYFEGGKPVPINDLLYRIEEKDFGLSFKNDNREYVTESEMRHFRNGIMLFPQNNDPIGAELYLKRLIKNKIIKERKNGSYDLTLENLRNFPDQYLEGSISGVRSFISTESAFNADRTLKQGNTELFYGIIDNMIKRVGYSDISAVLAFKYYTDKRLSKTARK